MAPWTGDLGANLAAQGQKFDGNPCTAIGAAESASKNGAQRHPNAARLVSKGPYSRVVQSHTSGNSSASCQRTPQSHTHLGGIPFESDILLILYHSISSTGDSASQPTSPIFDQEPVFIASRPQAVSSVKRSINSGIRWLQDSLRRVLSLSSERSLSCF